MAKNLGIAQLVTHNKNLTQLARWLTEREKSPTERDESPPPGWEELLHLSRCAPALLACLKECHDVFQQAKCILVSGHNPTDDTAEILTDIDNLSIYSRNVMQVATCGSGATGATIH